jgi:ArsR family transcriptional regulator, nickel/cobalt-responsive transcriptional repressor
VPHPAEHAAAELPLGRDEAERLAEAMRAFGSATRLRLLWALVGGEHTVEQLTAAVAMEQSAVSHQLRMLRQLRLVSVRRHGRRAFYRLHDHHLPELLAAMRHHHEHVTAPPRTTVPASFETQASESA